MSEMCESEEKCSCTTKPSKEGECNMPEKLLCLADEAWYEVLKEKMKAEIIKSCGDNLDKIAKTVTEANGAKWAHMVNGKVKCEEYKRTIKELMIACCD